jgi:glutamine synthetase
METEAVLQAVRASTSDYVKVAIVDIDGVLRGKYLDRDKFLAAATGDGFGFCDVVFGWDSADECYDTVSYTGWPSGYPDGAVRVDLATHRRIPWESDRDFFLCDFTGSGATYDVCPRRVLKAHVERATALGYTPTFAFELEWFNFRETPASVHDKGHRDLTPMTPGMFGYSILRQAHNQDYLDALLRELRAFGVPLEGLHTETGPGVLEAAIRYSGAVEAADRAVLCKSSIKEIAHRFGILPTFMARWSTGLPGCSGHTHQSLWDAECGTNLFAGDDPHGMSATFRSYLAGILDLLPECMALLAPTVNSYKRLVDGFWAPTTPSWGVDNRTVAARVITGSGAAPVSPGGTRLELRVPGSDVNPYLAAAFSLAAGLDGIERGLELGPPTVGSAYAEATAARLPRTLAEATDALAASSGARRLFGDGFIDHVCATREWEWRRFRDAVTDWELRRYLEII